MKRILRSLIQGKSLLALARLTPKNSPTFCEILDARADRHPDRLLLTFESERWTYGEFRTAVNRHAWALRSHGIGPGETVGLLMENRPAWLILHAAIARIGAVPALLSTRLKAAGLIHAVAVAEPRAIIVGTECLDRFKETRTDPAVLPIPVLTHAEHPEEGIPVAYPELATEAAHMPVFAPKIMGMPTAGAPLEYLYTSGTTGLSKATMVSHFKWVQIGTGGGGIAMGLLPSDVLHCPLPLFHNSSVNVSWASVLMTGCSMSLTRRFSVSTFWSTIQAHQATAMVHVGELCRYLTHAPETALEQDNPLEIVLGNGMRAEYWPRFQTRFGIRKIVEVYGATEGVGALMNLKGIPGRIGRLRLFGKRIGIVARWNPEAGIERDRRGRVTLCQPGETGMFLARIDKKSPFGGYKGNRDASREKILRGAVGKGDLWFVSGDLMTLHENDWVSFADRTGETFRWKGENVSTQEVADCLNASGLLQDASVYGVEVSGEEGRVGMAAVVPLEGKSIDLEALARHLAAHLPDYAIPKYLRITAEPDLTASFKHVKGRYQKEGHDPEQVKDPLYTRSTDGSTFHPIRIAG